MSELVKKKEGRLSNSFFLRGETPFLCMCLLKEWKTTSCCTLIEVSLNKMILIIASLTRSQRCGSRDPDSPPSPLGVDCF